MSNSISESACATADILASVNVQVDQATRNNPKIMELLGAYLLVRSHSPIPFCPQGVSPQEDWHKSIQEAHGEAGISRLAKRGNMHLLILKCCQERYV